MSDDRQIELNSAMQRHVLGAMLTDRGIMARVRSVSDPKYFTDETIADIVSVVNNHWDTHKQVPSRATLFDTFKGDEYRQHRREIKRAYAEDISDPEHTVERIVGYAQHRAFRIAIRRAAQIIEAQANGEKLRDERGKEITDDPEALIREAKLVGADMSDIGTFVDQAMIDRVADELLHPKRREKFTTGVEHLDLAGLMLERGEIGCVLGVAKGGKSQVLLNIALGNAKDGKNVLYYNCEMPDERMDARYVRRIAGRNAPDAKTDPEAFIAKARTKMSRLMKGRILVKRFIANTATLDDIRAHMTLVASELNFVPDLVIVDYLGIMKPRKTANDERRFELEANWLDFRAMCQEFNVCGWSAAQTNRGGANAELVTMSSIGECFAIVQHIDAGVSISMTQEERDENKGRFFVFASRNESDGVVIPFEHDYSRSLIKTQGIEKPTKVKRTKGGANDDKAQAAFDEEMDRRKAKKAAEDARP